jgi:hypothetical protein
MLSQPIGGQDVPQPQDQGQQVERGHQLNCMPRQMSPQLDQVLNEDEGNERVP